MGHSTYTTANGNVLRDSLSCGCDLHQSVFYFTIKISWSRARLDKAYIAPVNI